MKTVKMLIGILLCVTVSVSGGALKGAPGTDKPILMVVTSQEHFPGTKEKTGLWLEEFAVPYRIFREAGYRVTVASPKGGNVPVDPRSTVTDALPENAKEALTVLQDSVVLEQVDPAEYIAVFFPGGHGTMFDFPNNPPVQKTVEFFIQQDRPAALVCHGPAALVGAVDKNGQPLAKDRRVAAFTDAEEAAVGLTDRVPFLLQSRLEELGANVVPADNFKAHVIVDGNLVTGQNPASSAEAATTLVNLLKGESL